MIYGDFAYIYDSLMYDFSYEKVYNFIENVYDKKNINVKNILEMACGTGTLTKMMAEKYFVHAFDFSEEMLIVAQNKMVNNRNATFLKADMRRMNMGRKFDSCLCVCDGLNYIIDDDDISKIFNNVFNHLEDGGVFIFDMNSDYKFKNMEDIYIDDVFIDDEDREIFYVWENVYDEENSLNTYGVNFFIEEDEDIYRRVYEEHVERAYDTAFIKDALENAGFKEIEVFNGYSYNRNIETAERLVYIAVK